MKKTMMTPKVYCDHGSLTRELRNLQGEGRIEIVTFPYDDTCHKIKTKAVPSAARICDLHMPINQLPGTFADYKGSEHLNTIQTILGNNTRRDALHVDSAVKTACAYFFTMDINHILAKRFELERLLAIKFFHPRNDWDAFLGDLKHIYERAQNNTMNPHQRNCTFGVVSSNDHAGCTEEKTNEN